ncbi:phosphoenolpyruvate--protein phosphotransferase [Pelagibius litoralis]|uniref:phosphoenolpyruvate--protein phosphotransferase n=1 Tax=Pelagibius litoralis TaxID=374515 RepID=A0A967F2M0_9PROT|nr:phosphoenolpyruvate--protein phosphotransferase [Pelagibius litoralis]NIA71867.1 phosphoenolpyruvate--protein phosphotransferase [Pelagibius litoralis]
MTAPSETNHAWAGSRRLLRLLRDLMKAGGSSQERLDKVVELIAQHIVAEVCSIYAMRGGEVLELFASKGLKPAAVHKTRLQVNEGLVGLIAAQARPVALADAQSHPNFAYRPETGEEVYHSLMGVPIMRSGRVLGVLVVQNRTQRSYGEEEVEALETVAMVMAELLSGDSMLDRAAGGQGGGSDLMPARLGGITLNQGLAIGVAVPHHRGIVISQVVSENPEADRERLDTAMGAMRSALDAMLARQEVARAGEHREVLETYRMFADDRGWLKRMHDAVRGGLTAEASVQKVQNETRARMSAIKDPYLRARLADLDDLGNRLLHHLLGLDEKKREDLPEDMVLVAHDLGPAELLDYDQKRLRAVVLEQGAPTAHVAIVARALQIPMIGRCDGITTQVGDGENIIVDGETGQVLLRPSTSVRAGFQESIAHKERQQAAFRAVRDLPAVTLDGQDVTLLINAGLMIDLTHLKDAGAEGIGLYRTEVPFMIRDSFPGVQTQADIYSRILDHAGSKPVVFRTLDVGGDKLLPYWRGGHEDNPAMGWRAIRIGLDRPALLRQQLRALLRAAAGRSLSVMFPMISEVAEFEAAKTLLQREVEREKSLGGSLPTEIKVGAMLEVPALALQLPQLLPRCDFLSLGSNDLVQFLFAADRGNPRLARRYDTLSPAVLTLVRDVARRCDEHGVPLTVCGEMAGQPLEALALLACGVRRLSMAPGFVGPVKTMIRSLELASLTATINQLLTLPDHSIREQLRSYALERNISI